MWDLVASGQFNMNRLNNKPQLTYLSNMIMTCQYILQRKIRKQRYNV